MESQHMQIGEVAALTGLSLRTIRYYEEMGLVVPTSRSAGGFRLYSEHEVQRLQLVKRMKPLDFSLEETRELLATLDALASGEPFPGREVMVERLEMFHEAAKARVAAVRAELEVAEGLATELNWEVSRQKRRA